MTHAQPDLKIKRDGVKRKPLKGLRPNLPPKITKVNRGEKRPLSATWDNSERKKGKKHNIVEDVSDYDVWRLWLLYSKICVINFNQQILVKIDW